MVPISEEIEALSLDEFWFSTPNAGEVSSMPSDDDFQDPPSRPPIPKPASSSLHKTKVGQTTGLFLKSLSDWVDEIGKTQQALASNQKKNDGANFYNDD